MRKITLLSLLVVAGLAVALAVTTLRFTGDAAIVRELAKSFLEDLQFKDFRTGALYHHRMDQGRIDIGRALEELFRLPPELIDIMDYRLVRTEVDSTGRRARVITSTRFRRLNYDEEPKESELVLYWIRRHPDCPLGGACRDDGVCTDERGDPMVIQDKALDEEKERRGRQHFTGKYEDRKTEGEVYRCDASAEAKWFMNLDSTLKQKDYR